MRVLDEQVVPGAAGPMALNEAGDRLVVPVGHRELWLYDILSDGKLERRTVVPLPEGSYGVVDDGGDGSRRPSGTRATLFGDDQAEVVREFDYGHLQIALIDLRTGGPVRDASYDVMPLHPYAANPLFLSPRHLLIPTLETALCLKLPSLREVFRIRTYDDDYCPIGEDDATPDEQIAAGVAWDPATATLHVLWRAFNENNLQGYRFDLDAGTSTRLYRRGAVCEEDGVGLCLDPDGRGLTVMVQTMDRMLPLPPGAPEPPRWAPLGFLLRTDLRGGERGRLPLEGELRRDFAWAPHHSLAADGETFAITGYRFSAEDMATPLVYVAPSSLLVGTPGGLLLRADRSGVASAEIVHDLGGPISGLRYHAPTGRLFASGTDRLTVLRPEPAA